MSHARQQIRSAFLAALVNATEANANVFSGRVYPLQSAITKAIVVYTSNEGIDIATIGSLGTARSYMRDLSVVVEAYVKTSIEIDNALDALSTEIEEAIDLDAGIRNLVEDYFLSNVEVQLETNETPVGVSRMTYTVRYRTRPGAPQTIIS